MIKIQEESYYDVVDEVTPLVYEHGAETDHYQEYFTVDPDFKSYEVLSNADLLRIYTARDEGKLVGYLFFIVQNNPHYKTVVYACNDLIYVHPDYRNKSVVQSMFSFAEDELKEAGVSVITFHFKAHMDHPELAKVMGYDRAEIMYSKYIQGDDNGSFRRSFI